MRMFHVAVLTAGILALGLMTSSASATMLFGDGFDDNTADVKINQGTDTTVTYIDYSNFTVGATNFGLPEAPRQVGGSAATRGVLMQANLVDGAATAINVLAGRTPQTFTGNYRVSYDVWMSTWDPINGTGTTEQALYGLGVNDDATLEAAFERGGGLTIGTWGWLTNENGATTEDTAVMENATELADMGDNNAAGGDLPHAAEFFNNAFSPVALPSTENHAANNQWVRVDASVIDGIISLRYNGQLFFGNPKDPTVSSASTDGFAMLGYEDRFSSISGMPDLTWGVFDNFVVTAIPEPTSMLLLALGAVGLVVGRRRR